MVPVVAGTDGGGLGVGALGWTMSPEDTAESWPTGARAPTENGARRGIPPGNAKILATTYVPERLPSQYLRRWRA
jgi:hypothetical protein